MVAGVLWEHPVAGSSPASPTKKKGSNMSKSIYPYPQCTAMTYEMRDAIKVQAEKEGIFISVLIRKAVMVYLNEAKLRRLEDE